MIPRRSVNPSFVAVHECLNNVVHKEMFYHSYDPRVLR